MFQLSGLHCRLADGEPSKADSRIWVDGVRDL